MSMSGESEPTPNKNLLGEAALPAPGIDEDLADADALPGVVSPTADNPATSFKSSPSNGGNKLEVTTESPYSKGVYFDDELQDQLPASALRGAIENMGDNEGGLLSQLNDTMSSPAPSLRRQRTLRIASTVRRCCSCWSGKEELEKFHRNATRSTHVEPGDLGFAHTDDDEETKELAKPVAWIDSDQASVIFGVAIMLNCLVMAFETDLYDVQDGMYKSLFMTLEIIFIVIFSLEIAVRFKTHLLGFFCDSWNVFDVVIVGIGLVSIYLEIFLGGEKNSAMRVTSTLRALRLLRLARIVKLIRLFRELYLLVNGISSAMRALVWVAIMTGLVMLVCAIFITRTIGHSDVVRGYAFEGECSDNPLYHTRPRKDLDIDPDFHPIESPKLACKTLGWFGTVPYSMFSLFCVMTLEGWPEMCRTLMHRSSGGSVLIIVFFIFFVFFTNIFLLNLVTGVIVENVLLIAHQDEIEQVRSERRKREDQTKKLNELFILADTDQSQSVSREEFHAMLLNQEVLALLRQLEIHIWDAEDLFDILDVDDSGSMDIKEFFEGFSRVKGTAHGKHLLKLHYDILRENSAFRELVEKIDGELQTRLNGMSSTALEKMMGLEQVLHTELAPHIGPWTPGESEGKSHKDKGALAYDEPSLKPLEKPTRLPPSAALAGGVSPKLPFENGNFAAAHSPFAAVTAEEAGEVLSTLSELASTWQKIEACFDLALKTKSKESAVSQ
jgi:voltage-gated sodium channel